MKISCMSKRATRPTVAALMILCLGAAAFAQEQPPEGDGTLPIESEWDGSPTELYGKGDQTFVIALGTVFPLFFARASGDSIENNVKIGGAGSLNYNYYLNSRFALGGEFGGMFAGTLGENMLFVMPFGLKATWHFIASPFEFPVSLMVGAASQLHLENSYFGLIVKPKASAYWRYNPDWSFGLDAAWWWLPEWTDDPDTTVYGNFLELTLAARYHF